MGEMVAAARRVAEINSRIAASSREQASGIEQVSAAVAEMDGAMHENAGLVEKTGAAVRSLQSQADALAADISTFTRAA